MLFHIIIRSDFRFENSKLQRELETERQLIGNLRKSSNTRI